MEEELSMDNIISADEIEGLFEDQEIQDTQPEENEENTDENQENNNEETEETTVALVSEEILATISAYNNGFDEYEKSVEEVEKLKGEKEELLKVNGKLYQRIGFDREEKEDNIEDVKDEEETKIEDVIDEKGELI